MSTVKYSDEDELLTSDEYIRRAREVNDKNLQSQKDTAQKVLDSTNAALDRNYAETETTAGVNKQRNLVDADTAYQRSQVKYGAEEEALAGSGLSGSGLSEYKSAQAYAQNREDRQATYAEYDRIMREAAYNRDQGKLSAEVKYAEDVSAAEREHAKTALTIDKEALGYAQSESALASSAFNSYIDAINSGTMTIDQITADEYWSMLSEEQQTAINTAWAVKGFKDKIDNGMTLEEIEKSYGYSDLRDEGKRQVEAYYAEVRSGQIKDAGAALPEYLDMAMKGMSIDSIMAIAKENGHYDDLVESGSWTSVTNEAEKVASANANDETLTNIENAINDGATLEEIQAMEGYDELSDTDKATIAGAVEDRDERIEASVDYIIEEANAKVDANGALAINSLSALNSFLNSYTDAEGNLLSKDMKEKVVAKWQSNNAVNAIKGIEDESFFATTTGVTLAENIKNGVYGGEGASIAMAYLKKIFRELGQRDNTDVVDVAGVGDDLRALKDIIPVEQWNSMQGTLANAVKEDNGFKMSNDATYGGNPIKKGEKITDEQTLAALNRYKNANKSTQLLTVGDKMYYRDGDKWYTLEKDNTRSKTLTPADLLLASKPSTATTEKGHYKINGFNIGFSNLDESTKKLLFSKYSNVENGTYIEIDGNYYMYKGNNWVYAYITK